MPGIHTRSPFLSIFQSQCHFAICVSYTKWQESVLSEVVYILTFNVRNTFWSSSAGWTPYFVKEELAKRWEMRVGVLEWDCNSSHTSLTWPTHQSHWWYSIWQALQIEKWTESLSSWTYILVEGRDNNQTFICKMTGNDKTRETREPTKAGYTGSDSGALVRARGPYSRDCKETRISSLSL